jgi:GNAT superfamily N-acetyltransferase
VFTLAPLSPDTPGFDRLRAESVSEGHRMLRRFAENWCAGSNRFDRPGETMLGLLADGILVGTCGRNIDPYDAHPRAGRVRHLYVGQSGRRQGAGTRLIAAILDDAAPYFDYLNTNAPETAFAFYERQGFVRLLGVEHVTHRIAVPPA